MLFSTSNMNLSTMSKKISLSYEIHLLQLNTRYCSKNIPIHKYYHQEHSNHFCPDQEWTSQTVQHDYICHLIHLIKLYNQQYRPMLTSCYGEVFLLIVGDYQIPCIVPLIKNRSISHKKVHFVHQKWISQCHISASILFCLC